MYIGNSKTWKEYNTEIVQLEKNATPKKCTLEITKHEKSTEIVQLEKNATPKKCTLKVTKHEKSTTRKLCNLKRMQHQKRVRWK